MVRLAPLLVGFGLAAGRTMDPMSAVNPPATMQLVKTTPLLSLARQGAVHFPQQLAAQQQVLQALPSRQQAVQQLPAQQQALQQLPAQQQALPTHQQVVRQVYTTHQGQPGAVAARPTVNRDSASFQHHQSGGYAQPSGGYAQPSGGYQQAGYQSDSYNSYTEPQSYSSESGGGFLDKIGKYGILLVPVLLVIGLLFIFPSVVNVNSGRRLRYSDGPDDISDDLWFRLQSVYSAISEDEVCVSRIFCELGSAVGDTPFTERILKYIDMIYPTQSRNMLVMRKAAQADQPKCRVLHCSAWDDKAEE